MSGNKYNRIISRLRKHPMVNELVQRYEISFEMFNELAGNAIKSYFSENINNNSLSEEEEFSVLVQEGLLEYLEQLCKNKFSSQLHRVINATGTVLHTQLGRVRLSTQAMQDVLDVGKSYSTLELDVSIGRKCNRTNHIVEMLQELTGAEDAMVVNNNAAAFYLIMFVLASDREVLIARSEVIDSGDSFQVATMSKASGAILKEVGSTNQAVIKDYEDSITADTALILKVNTVNYRIIGTTDYVTNSQLFSLAKKHNLISYENHGSGLLFDFSKFGLGNEETVQNVIKKGVDIISFSGDKLLGGPQSGIILGKSKIIQRLRDHPLTRAFRIDKLTLAALGATLIEYNRGIKNVMKTVPTVREIVLPAKAIKQKAENLLQQIQRDLPNLNVFVRTDHDPVGDSVMSSVLLESYLVGIHTDLFTAKDLDGKLKAKSPIIIGLIRNDMYWFNMRTVENGEIEYIVKALGEIFKH